MKTFKMALIIFGISILATFFILKDQAGDIDSVYWRFGAVRQQLFNELSFPYFTPARCGGFHLCADTHDLIFTPYMLMSYLVPNAVWNVKFTNFLLSLVLWGGVYVWLARFGITCPLARIYTGLLTVLSGYWVCHLSHCGHVWGSGLAYLPWILAFLEDLSKNKFNHIKFLGMTFLLFLLINSGYYWLQVAFPIIGLRILFEAFPIRAANIKNIAVFALAGFYAVLLSLVRLAGIYEFQLKKFPRHGGEVSHFQIIGDTGLLIKSLGGAFFDPRVITEGRNSTMLGAWPDYSAYIGIISLIFIIIGLVAVMKGGFGNKKALLALLAACTFQFFILRTTHMADALRFVLPLFKQITWYWRGNAIFLLMFAVLAALGLMKGLNAKKSWVKVIALSLMVINLADISFAHITQMRSRQMPGFNQIFYDKYFPPRPFSCPVGDNCDLGYLFGYGHNYPPQISAHSGLGSTYVVSGKYFNLHDVRILASAQADGGVYLKKNWPLWPVEDKSSFEKFINYHQVVELPAFVKIAQQICLMAWGLFIFMCAYATWRIKFKRAKLGTGNV